MRVALLFLLFLSFLMQNAFDVLVHGMGLLSAFTIMIFGFSALVPALVQVNDQASKTTCKALDYLACDGIARVEPAAVIEESVEHCRAKGKQHPALRFLHVATKLLSRQHRRVKLLSLLQCQRVTLGLNVVASHVVLLIGYHI